MWSLPRRNHHRQYMPARNGDHATICGSDWRSSRDVAQPALPKPQVRAFVRRSEPSHRLTGTASSDPSSQPCPPSGCPLSMVDTISALYNASEHQHRTLTLQLLKQRDGGSGVDPLGREPWRNSSHRQTAKSRSPGAPHRGSRSGAASPPARPCGPSRLEIHPESGPGKNPSRAKWPEHFRALE